MDNPLENQTTMRLFTSLGLSKNSTKCYIASLLLGPSSVSEIAKHAGINRVDAYGAIQKLVEVGLVEQELTRRGRRIHAQSLDKLRNFAERNQKYAVRLRWKIEDLIPKILPFTASDVKKPKVMLFEGKDALIAIAERSLRAKPGSIIREIHPEDRYEVFGAPENYANGYYIPQRLKHHLFIRLLAPRSGYDRMHPLDEKQNRETRILPKGWGIASETFIYDDEVGLLWKHEEMIGIVIKSQKISILMQLLFDAVWDLVKTKL